MHAFSMEDRLFYTLPLLAESLHATPDFPRPTSYAQLCGWLARKFSAETHHAQTLGWLVGFRQRNWGLWAYVDAFLDLMWMLPDLSSRTARSIFVSGVRPSVRLHLLNIPHV